MGWNGPIMGDLFSLSCHTLLRGPEDPQGTNQVLMRGTCILEALGRDRTLGMKLTMQCDAVQLVS